MKTKLLILLGFISHHTSIAQIAYKAQRIDSLIESNFNSNPYKIRMDSTNFLSENSKQVHVYAFYDSNDNALKAVQEEDRNSRQRTIFYFHRDSLIGVNSSRMNEPNSNFYYFIGKDVYLKGTKKYKKTKANELIIAAKGYQIFFNQRLGN